MKNKAPYLPMSDCECYMEALNLVEQAIEDIESYYVKATGPCTITVNDPL